MNGLEICKLLSKGLTIKEASARLGITPAKIDWEIRKLKKEKGCSTTFQLMFVLGMEAHDYQ